MTIEELVAEVNQFIEDDERKIRVEEAKAALSATSPACRQVTLLGDRILTPRPSPL